MRGDEETRNANIDAGKILCEQCDGTGNQLLSMYQKCEKCGGTGYLPEEICGWCGKPYEEHSDKKPTEALPRVPCLMWKGGYLDKATVAKEKMTHSSR